MYRYNHSPTVSRQQLQELAAKHGNTVNCTIQTFENLIRLYNTDSYTWACPQGHTWNRLPGGSRHSGLPGEICGECPQVCRVCKTSAPRLDYWRCADRKLLKTCQTCIDKACDKASKTREKNRAEAAVRDAVYQASRSPSRVDELDDDVLVAILLAACSKTHGSKLPVARGVCKKFEQAIFQYCRELLGPMDFPVTPLDLVWFSSGVGVAGSVHCFQNKLCLPNMLITAMAVPQSKLQPVKRYVSRVDRLDETREGCKRLQVADGIKQALRLYGGAAAVKIARGSSSLGRRYQINQVEFASWHLGRRFLLGATAVADTIQAMGRNK